MAKRQLASVDRVMLDDPTGSAGSADCDGERGVVAGSRRGSPCVCGRHAATGYYMYLTYVPEGARGPAQTERD